ncbi:hypothetical protein AQJ91_16670 [Streptomyces dysideae]|uniref:Uncharacterized protein n=1 Tax=Streptomyces dysideae TaxID=909626 RepID=A0A101V059_9ACTN|nr:hypothetical protein AQJ91_16670 [Streptomyces dysideae]
MTVAGAHFFRGRKMPAFLIPITSALVGELPRHLALLQGLIGHVVVGANAIRAVLGLDNTDALIAELKVWNA